MQQTIDFLFILEATSRKIIFIFKPESSSFLEDPNTIIRQSDLLRKLKKNAKVKFQFNQLKLFAFNLEDTFIFVCASNAPDRKKTYIFQTLRNISERVSLDSPHNFESEDFRKRVKREIEIFCSGKTDMVGKTNALALKGHEIAHSMIADGISRLEELAQVDDELKETEIIVLDNRGLAGQVKNLAWWEKTKWQFILFGATGLLGLLIIWGIYSLIRFK